MNRPIRSFALVLRFALVAMIVAWTGRLNAQESPVVATIKNASGEYTQKCVAAADGKVTIIVKRNLLSPAVWTKTGPAGTANLASLVFWQLVDGYADGDEPTEVSLLLRSREDLVWIKVSRTGRQWSTDSEQVLHRVVSPAADKSQSRISLQGHDGVIVVDESGTAVTFTRNGAGELLRNGVPFANSMQIPAK